MKEGLGFKKILLATDSSKQADAATEVAIRLALASSATIRVVHVWNLEVHTHEGHWNVEMLSEAERLVDTTVARIREAKVVAEGSISRAAATHVAAALALAARTFEADLVVVGSRGLSDWSSMFQHSVSHRLLGQALNCPLLIVHDQPSNKGESQRVLLALAGGDDIIPGVKAALAAAVAPGSKVLVVHVAQEIVAVQGFTYLEPEDEIKETISTALQLIKEAGVASESVIIRGLGVAQAVAKEAEGWKADVIVTGPSHLGDLSSLLLGSVSHDLLRASERPLLISSAK